tara:strand:+ start:274 stop:468 length:195 start_codon:yes stop_codon:yes gene_type:complete
MGFLVAGGAGGCSRERKQTEAALGNAISSLMSAWICLHSRIFCRASGVSLARLAFNAIALAAAS